MDKGKIEFDDPTFRANKLLGEMAKNPLSIEQKREQVRKGDPSMVRYGGKHVPTYAELQAALDLANRKNAILLEGLSHYADDMTWEEARLESGGVFEDALYIRPGNGYDHAIAKMAEAEEVK